MITIYKYKISKPDTSFEVPGIIELLHFGEQNGELYVWAKVNTDKEFSKTDLYKDRIVSVGTGHSIPVGLIYRQTVQMSNGLVWHMYTKPTFKDGL